MAATFFFYDLETSGFNPREARIMQFAGQRTDLKLNPTEEPHNYLIKLTDNVLPDPDAVLITGITPQKTISEGLSEAEFLKIFHEQVATPGTIFVGFNSIRFDDEFMRYLQYRNFYEPYEWQWSDNRSRWDILDVVRMTRALRPEGIEWPFDAKGAPANRLESLTKLNKLDHTTAHDALSDVMATIEVAKLIRGKQPKLFDFLLSLRDKKRVAEMVDNSPAFVYTSGKYACEFEKTTVVSKLADHPKRQSALVFDLRYDPSNFVKLTPEALAEAWRRRRDDPGPRLPVKVLSYNRCPAIAPLSVLDKASQKRLQLSPKITQANLGILSQVREELAAKVMQTLGLLDAKHQAQLVADEVEVDARLYEEFFDNQDRVKMEAVRSADIGSLTDMSVKFKDQRLEALFPLYKARNFPAALDDDERAVWEKFRERKLLGGKQASRASRYFERLGQLAEQKDLSGEQRYLLEELQLRGQSILPEV